MTPTFSAPGSLRWCQAHGSSGRRWGLCVHLAWVVATACPSEPFCLMIPPVLPTTAHGHHVHLVHSQSALQPLHTHTTHHHDNSLLIHNLLFGPCTPTPHITMTHCPTPAHPQLTSHDTLPHPCTPTSPWHTALPLHTHITMTHCPTPAHTHHHDTLPYPCTPTSPWHTALPLHIHITTTQCPIPAHPHHTSS